MRRRKIKHVMTRDVVFAHDYTDFKDIVRMLAVRGVSPVLLVDNEKRVTGADLPAKQSMLEPPTAPARLRFIKRYRRRPRQPGRLPPT